MIKFLGKKNRGKPEEKCFSKKKKKKKKIVPGTDEEQKTLNWKAPQNAEQDKF